MVGAQARVHSGCPPFRSPAKKSSGVTSGGRELWHAERLDESLMRTRWDLAIDGVAVLDCAPDRNAERRGNIRDARINSHSVRVDRYLAGAGLQRGLLAVIRTNEITAND